MFGARTPDVAARRRWTAALVLGTTMPVLAALTGLSYRVTAHATVASTILREPRNLRPGGEFVHPAGFVMPERSGPFTRASVLQYDAEGWNVSAGYLAVVGDETRLPVIVTLYVYPKRPGQELDAYFEGLLADLGGAHGDARPEFQQKVTLGRGFDARYAGFGYSETWVEGKPDVTVRSYLVLYAWESWWVKWRATTPAPIDNARMRAIVDLTESLRPPRDEEATADLGPVAESTRSESSLRDVPFAASAERDAPHSVLQRSLK